MPPRCRTERIDMETAAATPSTTAPRTPGTHGSYERLLAACRSHAPIRMAAAHPCSAEALEAVLEARAQGLIVPVLVGPPGRMQALAQESGLDIAGLDIVATEH